MKYKYVTLEQGSPDWHVFRSKRIGASNVPIIMKESNFSTPNQLWRQKIGLEEVEENFAMKRGREREEEARIAFVRHIGIEVVPTVLVSSELDFMMASLDGLSEDGIICVEIKNVNLMDHASAQINEVPKKYYGQCQAQLFVTGLGQMYYFSYMNESNYACVTVFRDEAYIAKMLSECAEFYRYLTTLDEPPLIDRDYVNMNDNTEFVEKAKFYKKIDEEIKNLTNVKEDLRKDLLAMSENKNCMCSDIRLTKYTIPGRIDYTQIPELQNIELDQYRKKASIAWRIS